MIIRNTASRQFGRLALFCLMAASIFAAPQSARAAGDLIVEEFAGSVKLKMDDRWQDPRVRMSVRLPATVSTGGDGSIKLAQDGSVFSVAASTAIEIFATPDSGELVKRVVQTKGSAFYDISAREHRKLRVETPYLAAVIKGTQFNVTVEPESSSIALYEGLLRIEAPDVDQAIELQAGFIARRRAGDTTITVIPMDGGDAVSGKRSGVSGSGDSTGAASAAGNGHGSTGDADLGTGEIAADLGGDAIIGELDAGLDAGVDADLDSSEVGVNLGADATVGDLADLDADAGIGADLGTGEVGADLGTNASVGDLADLDADAGIDADLGTGELGVDLTADTEVAGVTGFDAGVDADLASGEVDVDASVGDVGLDVGLDVGELDNSTTLTGELLDGEETGTDETTQEEEEVPLLDPGNLLGL